MKKLLVLLLLVTVLLSGCIGELKVLVAGTDIAEIINNPEKYEDKLLTVNGKLAESVIFDNYYLTDKQGYKLRLGDEKCIEKGRIYETGSYYEAKGYLEFGRVDILEKEVWYLKCTEPMKKL